MKTADADRLLAFVRAGQKPAQLAAQQARRSLTSPAAQADWIVEHWRREVAVLTAAPGLGGRLSDVVVDIVGATAQGLLVLSLCELSGCTDEAKRTDLIARHVLDTKVPVDWAPAATIVAEPAAGVDDAAWRRVLSRAPGALAGALRTMWAVRKLTGDRAEGRLWHRTVAYLPVVGVLGRLTGERHALSQVAARVRAELGT